MTPSNRNRASQLTASSLGARLWRMSVGLFWSGKAIEFTRPTEITGNPGDVLIRNARPVKNGYTGMSDGLGFVPVVVTADMVGQTVPVFLAIEDKTGKGAATPEQKSFIRMVRSFGGRAGVARTDEDVAAIVRGEVRD